MVHPSSAPAPEAPVTMQETTKIKAKLTNVGDTMQATDTRDGKKYWITKLADGNIWMTQNLSSYDFTEQLPYSYFSSSVS